jgi:chloramphenicol 3-O-phosphotransferase
MAQTRAQGQIIILNGAPRSGKSSIVEVIQDTFDGVWINLGIDGFMQTLCPWDGYSEGWDVANDQKEEVTLLGKAVEDAMNEQIKN